MNQFIYDGTEPRPERSGADGPRVPLRLQHVWTEDGAPLTLKEARSYFGRHIQPDVERGWFWGYATPLSAWSIARYGHHAIGSLTTTRSPRADGYQPSPAEVRRAQMAEGSDGVEVVR